jgi:hypothetical protein
VSTALAGRAVTTLPRARGLLPLARREAWRLITSPAILVMALYCLLLTGVGAIDGESFLDRAKWAEFIAYVCLLFLGPVTYISAHLVASSARRGGASPQFDAAPMDGRRRDLALCLGVLIGPAAVALGLALLGARLAFGIVFTDPDGPTVVEWSATDVAQIPALILGAGILGVVVARWLRFPGSLIVGFLGMCALTLWMMAPPLPATRPWFSWFALISWFSDVDAALTPTPSMAWHTVYLLAWSWIGVCAVALRHPEGRRPWLVGLGVGVILLASTGVAQLPAG